MKRSKPLSRTRPLRSGPSRLQRGRIAKINTARQAKRRKAYAAKLAKARQGQGYAEAMARAGGRCEWVETITATDILRTYHAPVRLRCLVTEELHAHHKTYSRFGGDEIAEDYMILCKRHHTLIESQQHPHRQSRRSGVSEDPPEKPCCATGTEMPGGLMRPNRESSRALLHALPARAEN